MRPFARAFEPTCYKRRFYPRGPILGAVIGALTVLLTLGAMPSANAQTSLKITSIPEEAATEQIRKIKPLADYLTAELGMPVEFTPVNDYPAAVETLVNKKVDAVWFGGFTFVQAKLRSGNKVIPIIQREEDTQFQSVFIAKTASGIKNLSDLKGKTVSFGSQSSTSGHLMPRSFLLDAGLNPEKDFKRVAYSKAHDATIASVVSGQVDAAALDITVWKKFVTENKVDTNDTNVFHTTPGYYNYNWAVHQDMPAALREKLAQAFLKLDPKNPAHAELLKLNRASRYIRTDIKNYAGIEAAGRSAGLID
jgi:phosphonate transport system substrate-binding protein